MSAPHPLCAVSFGGHTAPSPSLPLRRIHTKLLERRDGEMLVLARLLDLEPRRASSPEMDRLGRNNPWRGLVGGGLCTVDVHRRARSGANAPGMPDTTHVVVQWIQN